MAAALLCAGATVQAQGEMPDQVGNVPTEKFRKANEKGAQKVAEIKPDTDKASATDRELMERVAMGGMRQLLISQAVVARATNPTVKMLAQSEVDEQTGVSNKLKEIAAAAGVTLPAMPDATAQAITKQVEALSGTELDQLYLDESGVKGHEALQQTMTTVSARAKNKALRKLAEATLPVIKMHLEIAKAERAELNNGASR
ncbi:hypothetical protein GCM10023184_45860 [Flaviaesturariibacter amylovorans]|uniref:DUF4142 domain-containing protein n=2 Tax=Flaviaesturariibacter amylovorans TaxID=1084520 RepID=A0ABP8HU79_9BACT